MYVPQAHVQNYVHNNDNSPPKSQALCDFMIYDFSSFLLIVTHYNKWEYYIYIQYL